MSIHSIQDLLRKVLAITDKQNAEGDQAARAAIKEYESRVGDLMTDSAFLAALQTYVDSLQHDSTAKLLFELVQQIMAFLQAKITDREFVRFWDHLMDKTEFDRAPFGATLPFSFRRLLIDAIDFLNKQSVGISNSIAEFKRILMEDGLGELEKLQLKLVQTEQHARDLERELVNAKEQVAAFNLQIKVAPLELKFLSPLQETLDYFVSLYREKMYFEQLQQELDEVVSKLKLTEVIPSLKKGEKSSASVPLVSPHVLKHDKLRIVYLKIKEGYHKDCMDIFAALFDPAFDMKTCAEKVDDFKLRTPMIEGVSSEYTRDCIDANKDRDAQVKLRMLSQGWEIEKEEARAEAQAKATAKGKGKTEHKEEADLVAAEQQYIDGMILREILKFYLAQIIKVTQLADTMRGIPAIESITKFRPFCVRNASLIHKMAVAVGMPVRQLVVDQFKTQGVGTVVQGGDSDAAKRISQLAAARQSARASLPAAAATPVGAKSASLPQPSPPGLSLPARTSLPPLATGSYDQVAAAAVLKSAPQTVQAASPQISPTLHSPVTPVVGVQGAAAADASSSPLRTAGGRAFFGGHKHISSGVVDDLSDSEEETSGSEYNDDTLNSDVDEFVALSHK